MGSDFAYSNHSHRPRGPVLSTLSAVVPAVRVVQEQVQPYATWWETHNRVAASGREPLWVALGDSMTQGIGATAPDRGWVGQLDDRLTRRGWEHRVVNLGVNGARVEDLLDRQLPVLEALSTADRPAVLVTVLIGSNDIVLRRHRRSLVERFGRMLDLLPEHAVVSNLPNPRHEARAIDAMLRERAEAGRLVLVDLRREGPRSWRGRLASDRFHPNDRGYADLATIVERALERSGLLTRS
ncbi:SGNH/GDSL hydrolase family protein [Intrasporangium sp. YIM S08009]|uniref:SGNH/GDSL hydrolase family protein n=1 Tax=Intrasporangium zincisolvens TaxID=3080018 RepID=UPI002B0561E3|nr:SGNH/GDSL hydrolase family protein [Intrasporangium sp. YIM S08009]